MLLLFYSLEPAIATGCLFVKIAHRAIFLTLGPVRAPAGSEEKLMAIVIQNSINADKSEYFS